MPHTKEEINSKLIMGINSVSEALSSGKTIEKILLSNTLNKRSSDKIFRLSKEKSVPIKKVDRKKLDLICENLKHQGVVAFLSEIEYSSVEDILSFAQSKNEFPFIVIADCIEDPHNLGAIIRSAECAGVHGVIIPKRHCCGITPTVFKSSAGALGHIMVSRVSNLSQTIDKLKANGVWIYCADMDGKIWYNTDFSGAVGLIVGSEGNGVSKILKDKSDFTVSLPLNGKINSLNASVATGIIMFEIVRQRKIKGVTEI